MFKEFICNGCHNKCILTVESKESSYFIHGNKCSKGIKYADCETNNNKDIFTTVIRIKGAKDNVVSVKSNKPIDKELWIECSKALSMLHVGAPMKIGDIACRNLLNTGVDIICTKNVCKI